MHVIRHEHIAHQRRLEASTDFSEDLRRDISITRRSKEFPALIAGEGNKMKIAATGDPFEAVRHGKSETPAHPCLPRKGRPRMMTER
jgi:hypothetical protein